MSDNITTKITKFKNSTEENNKKYAFYEVESFNYGEHNYSRIKIEYQEISDLSKFVENKSIKIEVGKDMTIGEGDTLVIKGGTWNADKTVWQKIKDKTKDTIDKIGDTSSKAVKGAGEGLEKTGENLKESADKDKWPHWVLPVAIAIGVILLIAIIAWIFKPKRR